MNDLQRPQAMVPEGGVVLENPNSAPRRASSSRTTRRSPCSCPARPANCARCGTNEALPWLRKHFAARLTPVHEVTLRLLGIGETRCRSLVEERVLALGPVEVGYCARPGEVDLRLIAPDEALARQRRPRSPAAKLGDAIYAEGAETMEEAVVRLARAAGKTVATAESCTGGLVASRITNVPGSSEFSATAG